MSSNSRWVLFQRSLARNAMYTSAWVFERIPHWFMFVFIKTLMAIAFPLVKRHRKIAKESMDIALGDELTDEEKFALTKKCFKNFGLGMAELLYYMAHPKFLAKYVEFEGLENLDTALKKGNGVVAVTAHYGNFPLMMLALAHKGYDISTILRPARDKNLSEYLYKRKKENNVNPIYALPRNKCVTESLKALRNNGVLFIPIDQNFGSGGGVYVDFFGYKAATATGPVVFARRTNAQILPMFIMRQEKGIHKVIIEPAMTVVEKATDEETYQFNMALITKLIEKYIRQYPHEWAWMHRRWKTKPESINNSTQ